MNIIIKEIKAKCHSPSEIEQFLKNNKADYVGLDHQIDTYFHVPIGKLKLRQGNIESQLIYYDRTEVKDIKESHVNLYKPHANVDQLKTLLTNSCGIKAVVDKKRKIFYIDNVKFHIDEVVDLGHFVEIEAIGEKDVDDENGLYLQCRSFMKLLGIKETDLIDKSYSDMIIEK